MDFIPIKNNRNSFKKIKKYCKNGENNSRRLSSNRKFSFGGDNKLIPRIKQYLRNNQDKPLIDVEEMVEDLQCIYKDYQRKKRNSFKTAVNEAYDHILQYDEEFRMQDNKSTLYRNDINDNTSEGEFSSDNDNYVQTEDTNFMNKHLQTLYNSNKSLNITSEEVSINQNSEDQENSPSKNQRSRKRKKIDRTHQQIKKTKNGGNTENKKAESFGEISNLTFDDIAGCKQAILKVAGILHLFKNFEIYAKAGLHPPVGILLHGPPGCGKTTFAYAIAGTLHVPFFRVASTELVSGVSGESEEKIRDVFSRAIAHSPSVIFIDEIDAITPKREMVQKEMEKRMVTQLQMCLDELVKKDNVKQVLVIGATNLPDSLDPALRRAGRFEFEICFGIPDENARLKILELLYKDYHLDPECDLQWIAHNTPGYVGADLMSLVKASGKHAMERALSSYMNSEESDEVKNAMALIEAKPLDEDDLKRLNIIKSDIECILKMTQPSAKREGFATVPDVKWDDVGALKDIRDELQFNILFPIRFPKVISRAKVDTPAGILMFGPPGCGKTLVAKAIANETGLNFISVKGAEFLNMYVGETERAIRQCFQRAKNSAPCIIFFDEIDSLCPQRSIHGQSGYESRVVTSLLTEMDGFEARKGVFILAATNRPDLIDRSFLRPRRLEKILYIGLPLVEDRIDILKTVTKNGTEPKLAANVDLASIAQDPRCDRFSGADLSALVDQAKKRMLMDIFPKLISEETTEDEVGLEIKAQHFEEALQTVKPSVSLKDIRMYEEMKQSLQNELLHG